MEMVSGFTEVPELIPSHKPCAKCGNSKPLSEFHKQANGLYGFTSRCKDCENTKRKKWYLKNRERRCAETKQWKQNNPEKCSSINKAWKEKNKERLRTHNRDYWLRRKYGVDVKWYESTLLKQKGGCAVCGDKPTDRRLSVDHDHETGEVRGILCDPCNTALGLLQESHERIEALCSYLTKYKG